MRIKSTKRGRKTAQKSGIALQVEEEAVSILAGTGSGLEYGVRPLRRAVAAMVEDPAADLMLSGELRKGGALRVWAEDGSVRVTLA